MKRRKHARRLAMGNGTAYSWRAQIPSMDGPCVRNNCGCFHRCVQAHISPKCGAEIESDPLQIVDGDTGETERA